MFPISHVDTYWQFAKIPTNNPAQKIVALMHYVPPASIDRSHRVNMVRCSMRDMLHSALSFPEIDGVRQNRSRLGGKKRSGPRILLLATRTTLTGAAALHGATGTSCGCR